MLPCRQRFQSEGWSSKYLLILIVLASIWAIENFIMQASAFASPPVTSHPYFIQEVRLILNFTVAVAILLVCSQPVLVMILAGNLILSVIVVTYNHYFHHTFSVYYGIKALKESSQAGSFGLHLIPLTSGLFLLGTFTVKLLLLLKIPPRPVKFCRVGALLCLLTAGSIILALQCTHFAFRSIAYTRVTRAVYAYGYLNSWIAEFFVAPDTREVARELAALQSVSPDRLSAAEIPWQFGTNVVVVQLESFGWNVMDYSINGQKVMPYVSGLAMNSRLFKIQAYHHVSSGDMDYAVLSDGTPTKRMISYLVPNVHYTNALPRFMQKHGFHTVAMHGANGDFFDRRGNYERMGFDEIWFQEDFRGRTFEHSYWGVKDAELFRMSSARMRDADRPQFHFIISLDSHGPFDLIGDAEKEIFPKSRVWQENYFNSMRALDRDLRGYVESLPNGTLVILYGDHTSSVDYGDFHSAHEGQVEYVPCIVHVCQDKRIQQTRFSTPESVPEDLRILDVMNFLRRQIAAR